MRAATAFERHEKLIIHSSSKTTDGVWISSSPFLLLEERNPILLGASIRKCLSDSQSEVPHPKDFKNLFSEVLALAKVKSYKDFVRGSTCVEIEQIGDEVRFVPTKNTGFEDGFIHLGDALVFKYSSDDLILGEGLLSALDSSR